MIDRQTVCRRLHALEAYTAELERLAATLSRADFDGALGTQWMVEHGLQLAIESVLGIGSHLVAGEQLGSPQSYREVIELLGQRGILPQEFVAHVRGMPGVSEHPGARLPRGRYRCRLGHAADRSGAISGVHSTRRGTPPSGAPDVSETRLAHVPKSNSTFTAPWSPWLWV